MPEEGILDESITTFVNVMMKELDERQRRIFLALYSDCLGRGGATKLSEITGISQQTISAGKRELKNNGVRDLGETADGRKRIRAEGGGRKSATEVYPQLKETLLSLLDSSTVGNPMNYLLWTVKSTRTLSRQLKELGINVSSVTVGKILEEMGFSLQQNKKYTECGDPGPDRNGQFEFISSETNRFIEKGLPVISVDAKKKENVGNFKNNGAKYEKKGNPTKVSDHDFCSEHAIPYGVFDVANNEGYVNVGISADTAEFAVESIGEWWYIMGQYRYPDAKEVMITCDGGGSNGSRVKLWKYKLQEMSDFTGLTFHVRHFPPGTSKWNKIEHRMFSYISMNWKGMPLTSYETIVNLIGATTNTSGLRVKCVLDKWDYKKGIEISDEQMATLNLLRNEWRGDWNYTISPRKN